MEDAILIVMWYRADRVWVAKDARHIGLFGEGNTPEDAIRDLREQLQDTLDLDTPIWAWKGTFNESHI